MNDYPKLTSLEKKVHQLITVVEQLGVQNKQLQDELNLIRKKKRNENMDSVKREIIRTKVQTMLDLLEGI